MVSTKDSESFDPGSNPGRSCLKHTAFVAEWSKALDSSSSLFGGVGSNPTECILLRWRNWIARETSNLKVVGSIPTRSVLFVCHCSIVVIASAS